MSTLVGSNNKDRQGAEIVYGAEACHHHCMELLSELGFPRGVLPLKGLEECGRIPETGFVWMKLKSPYEHFFKGTNTKVSYASEVTAFVEKKKMKKMTGVKTKELMLCLSVVDIYVEDPSSKKITFKTGTGLSDSFPMSAFVLEE